MSYHYFAKDYLTIPEVEDAALRPLDARGEPKGELVEDITAHFYDEVSEGLTGQPIGLDGETMRIVVFIDTVPPEHRNKLISHTVIIRRSDDTRWIVTLSQKRLYGTRWVCDCRKERTSAH